MTNPREKRRTKSFLEKSPTGIQGLDKITGGGLPKGRPTLVAGGAGSGKTLIAMEFLVQGATIHNEPGIFVTFEETAEDLVKNFSSLGYDLKDLTAHKKMILDYIYVERSEIEMTGEYDLEGLFIRLQSLIDSIGAKRIVLDTLEALFGALPNEGILRAELRRLFRWLKQKGLTAVITAEKGSGTLTRHGLEEYVSDCVIFLDHQIRDQVATRRLRIVKYRGSSHGTNEYPFLIDNTGITVLPITAAELTHEASSERVSSGIPRLDMMLDGKGYYRGSSILISGTAGTGKSSLAAHFAKAVCSRNQRCLYFAFEESESQIIRNMRSIGLDLKTCEDMGLLKFFAARPTMYGLEMHLAKIHNLIEEYKPSAVVLDPITNLISIANPTEVKAMLTRLIDFLKMQKITAVFTNLSGGEQLEATEIGISSVMDTWILLRDIELNGERDRGLYVLKARGMAHSNQIREFQITANGIDLIDVYVGGGQVLTGSARIAQEARETAEEKMRLEEIERRNRELERKRRTMEAQVGVLKAEYESQEEELQMHLDQLKSRERSIELDRDIMKVRRDADKHTKRREKRGGKK